MKSMLMMFGIVMVAIWARAEYADDCITFSSEKSFKLVSNDAAKHWDGTIWISTNKTNWTEWNGDFVSAAQTGDTYNLYVRGDTNNTKITGRRGWSEFQYKWCLVGNNVACTGNIETLRGATGDDPSPTKMAADCYYGMFANCKALTAAPTLPATTLADYCYESMFKDCTALKAVPELPATALAEYCYKGMFWGCTALTVAPALPAKTLADCCYNNMFRVCTALKEAPAISATTLARSCCVQMFYGCTALTNAPALPATTLAIACYASMFDGCTALKEAPALPATTLADQCYYCMFAGCTALEVNMVGPGRAWKIPVTSTMAGDWGVGMFAGTKGTLQGQPELNATYYIASAPPEPIDDCITFSSSAAFTLKTANASKNWDGTLWTSTDKINWTEWNGEEVFATRLDNSYRLHLRGNASNTKIAGDSSVSWKLSGTDSIACVGNIETLRGATGDAPASTPMASACYAWMFYNCSLLTIAPELPAMELSEECYQAMFYVCRSLIRAPRLPATTLTVSCYSSMFYGCTALPAAPELPAKQMSKLCYGEMFGGCLALLAAPELPATMLADSCYAGMFHNCKALVVAPALPATTLKYMCYREMFSGCGLLTDLPVLPATKLINHCYDGMFKACSSLVINYSGPGKEWKIPATVASFPWGSEMFNGTSGAMRDQPMLNTTYYIASAKDPVEPGGEIVVPEGKAEAKAEEINNNPAVKAQYLKAPGGIETTAQYRECFDAVATSGSTVAFVLNEEGTNQVVEATTAAKTNTLESVLSKTGTLVIGDPLIGFYYSLKQGSDVTVGDKADLNKLAGRDTLSFPLTTDKPKYFYQSLVTPTPLPKE